MKEIADAKDMTIDQCKELIEALDSFLDIKPAKETNRTLAFRIFWHCIRPLRFFWRILKSFALRIAFFIKKLFMMTFLIPQKKNILVEEPNNNVLFIKGDWGVGKTFMVKHYFESNEMANEKYQPVFIDLFGLSSIDELNKKVIKGMSFSKTKQKEKTIKIYAKATIENKFSGLAASLEIGIILSKKIEKIRQYNRFVEKENAIYKRCRYRCIKEPVIILDDIERKNKELSLESILGFVDIFKKQGIKTILIANAIQLELNEKEMYHLLDRVADKTCYVYDIKNSIDSFIEYFQNKKLHELKKRNGHILTKEKAQILILKDLTCNLRTFKRFADILVEFDREFDYSDRPLLNMILLCLINQCEGKYLFSDLVSFQTDKLINQSKIDGDEKSYNAAYNETLEAFSHLKNDRFQTFYFQAADVLERFKVFKGDKGKDFVKTVYECLDKGTIDELKQCTFKYQLCPLQNVFEDRSTIKVPKAGYKNAHTFAKFIEKCLSSKEISKFYLLMYVCRTFDIDTDLFNRGRSKTNDRLSSILDRLVNLSSAEFLSHDWEFETSFMRYIPPQTAGTYNSSNLIKNFFKVTASTINRKIKTITIEERVNILYRVEDTFSFVKRPIVAVFYGAIKDKFFIEIASYESGAFVEHLENISSRSDKAFKERIQRIVQDYGPKFDFIENSTFEIDDLDLEDFKKN